MTLQFTRAVRRKVKLRLAASGSSGSGKTYTMLRIASGLAEALGGDTRVALIDTEEDSSLFYADQFQFDSLSLRRRTIPDYCEAMHAAARAGYGVAIIDSLSHAWQELLQEVDAIAKARYRGNTFMAWSEGTPKQRLLIDAILGYPGHLLCTMRAKTEWALEETSRGKTKPVRVGLQPEQRKGMEYEFDVVAEISAEHIMTVTKSRIAQLQDRLIEKPGEDLGKELAAWLETGEDAPASAAPNQGEVADSSADGDRVVPSSSSKQTQAAEAFARRLNDCPTLEDLSALTRELEEAHLVGEERALVAKCWQKAQVRLAPQAPPPPIAQTDAPAENMAS